MRPCSPSLLTLACLALLLAVPASLAHGQACHTPSLRATSGALLRANLGGVFATYDNARGRGEYQGGNVLAAYSHEWFFVDASLPYYRLVRDGHTAHGIGDVATDLRVHALRWSEYGLVIGPELATTLPSGDAHHDLGMGHVMLMPGAFLSLQTERFTLIAQLAYGGAVGGAGMHHGGITPLVAPMNSSELEHALGAGYAVHELVRLTGRVLGAVPVGTAAGLSREVVAGGVQLVLGAVDVSLEQHVPIVGQPFQTKTVLNLGGQW